MTKLTGWFEFLISKYMHVCVSICFVHKWCITCKNEPYCFMWFARLVCDTLVVR